MKQLDRYIVQHIFGFTAVVGLGLITIQALVAFVAQLDEVGRGGFSYSDLFLYTILQLPAGIYVMLPIMGMIGTLMGLGALASSSELTAMRASGVSLLRIGGATVIAGAILGAGAFAIGDWAAPQGQQLADDLKAGVKGKGGMGGKSVWLREGPHVFHVRKLISEDHVGALDIYTLGADLSLSAATHVEEGVYEKGQWEFSRVHRTEFADGAATVLELPSLDWHGTLSPEVLKLFVLEADALSVRGLLRLIRYLRQNSLDSRSYELALDRKLVAPLTVMTMMLFAIPFVLGPLRNTGAGQRLFVGILVGLGFYVINEVTANTGQIYGWYPLLAASAPTLVFAGIGAWRLQRVR